jgi:ribosomal protein S24E
MEIIKENKNPLFKRREVGIKFDYSSVPSHSEAKKMISERFNCKEELIRIKKIDSKFGSKEFTILANIYDSIEEFNRVVKKTKQEIDAEKKAKEERKAKEAEEKEAKKAAEEAAKAEAEKPEESVEEKEESEEKAEEASK